MKSGEQLWQTGLLSRVSHFSSSLWLTHHRSQSRGQKEMGHLCTNPPCLGRFCFLLPWHHASSVGCWSCWRVTNRHGLTRMLLALVLAPKAPLPGNLSQGKRGQWASLELQVCAGDSAACGKVTTGGGMVSSPKDISPPLSPKSMNETFWGKKGLCRCKERSWGYLDLQWALSAMSAVFIRNRRRENMNMLETVMAMQRQRSRWCQHSPEAARQKEQNLPRSLWREYSPANTLAFRLPLSCCCFKPPSLQSFVMATKETNAENLLLGVSPEVMIN